MGEIRINPKFNVHEKYKEVNIINSYRFGGGGSTNWNTLTGNLSYDSVTLDGSTQTLGNTWGVDISPDGTKLYKVSYGNDRVWEYTLSTAWDLSSGTYSGNSFLVSGSGSTPLQMRWKPDGLQMFLVGSGSDTIRSYTASTAWDVSTLSYNSDPFSLGITLPFGFYMREDGLQYYIIHNSIDYVYTFDMSVAWDLSTSVENSSKRFSIGASNRRGIYFNPNGLQMYLTDLDGFMYEYSMDEWDISTAVFVASVSTTDSATCNSVFFKPDGTKVYMEKFSSGITYQYSL